MKVEISISIHKYEYNKSAQHLREGNKPSSTQVLAKSSLQL